MVIPSPGGPNEQQIVRNTWDTKGEPYLTVKKTPIRHSSDTPYI